jgi:hypothetical protein
MIVELEGLFRHLYRKDSGANRLTVQRAFKEATKATKDLGKWD